MCVHDGALVFQIPQKNVHKPRKKTEVAPFLGSCGLELLAKMDHLTTMPCVVDLPTLIIKKSTINVGKYTSPMDDMA